MRPVTLTLALGALLAVLLVNGRVSAGTKVYALVMGNNASPPDSNLKILRFADDDAVRFYNFFELFSDDVFLLTVPDTRTQRRYPWVVDKALVPSLANFQSTVKAIAGRIEKNKRSGDAAVVYLVFSGHGAYDDNGDSYLTMRGGSLTRATLYDALSQLNADYTHLFIDACYAEGVVGARGLFDTEAESRHITLTPDSIDSLSGNRRQYDLPGLGVVMAASEYQKTHEWSQIESGVFTHEILSGLAGPADVNLDGKIEYSELVAFVASANRNVTDERGRIQVVARPPERNLSVPLIDLNSVNSGAFLTGDASSLGHFFIDLENGERYLDAHLGETSGAMHILVPTSKRAYLHSGQVEAALKAGAGRVIDIAALSFKKKRYHEKGSISASLQKGLFSAKYSAVYYTGFVDSTGLPSVKFDVPKMELTRARNDKLSISARRKMAITGLSVGAVAAITAVVSGALALKKRSDFENSKLQVPSIRADREYRVYTSIFWTTAAVAPIALLAGVLLMPRRARTVGRDTAINVRARGGLAALEMTF